MRNSILRKPVLFLFFLGLLPFMTMAQVNEWAEDNDGQEVKKVDESILGRWDLTVDVEGEERPSWLEVTKSGFSTFVGRFVAMEGSSRPISKVHFEEGKLFFTIPPQWSMEPNDLQVFGSLDGEELSGVMRLPNGKEVNFRGERAPVLERPDHITWGEPIKLIEGQKLEEVWKANGPNQWILENDVLKSPKSGSNLITLQKFQNFKLHVEVRYPEGSNSGIYLRGRHEVQVVDSIGAKEPSDVILGAVYGFLEPSELADKGHGHWEELDITLVGRHVTVVVNGVTVINDRRIPGITGGALDSKEAEPGPIYLQGDHGPVEYRNMIITPAKE